MTTSNTPGGATASPGGGPVEDLRSAAVLLRQRAGAATKGPWRREYPDGPSTQIASDVGTVVVPGVAARWRWPRAEDADYIATMHPLVGLALADVFDDLAQSYEHQSPGMVELMLGGMANNEHRVGSPHPVLRLARLILGGSS